MRYNTKILKATAPYACCTGIAEAAEILLSGELVAFPTETVYGLGAVAFNTEAIKKIFIAKGRPSDNPLIVHIAEQSQISEIGILNKRAKKLSEKLMPGALTLVIESKDNVPLIARANLPSVAVRIPQNEVALELIRRSGPLVAPSANLSTKPSPTEASHVFNDLQGRIYAVLDGGSCKVGIESTVIDTTTTTPVILRSGAVTKEELEKVLQEKIFYPNSSDNNIPNKSPGMKYKHYAPNAPVSLLCGKDELYLYLNQPLTEENRIIITTKNHIGNLQNYFPKKNIFELSQQSIYGTLRKADELNATEVIIYFEVEDNLPMGLIDRIKKASGN